MGGSGSSYSSSSDKDNLEECQMLLESNCWCLMESVQGPLFHFQVWRKVLFSLEKQISGDRLCRCDTMKKKLAMDWRQARKKYVLDNYSINISLTIIIFLLFSNYIILLHLYFSILFLNFFVSLSVYYTKGCSCLIF